LWLILLLICYCPAFVCLGLPTSGAIMGGVGG
jgi:hypothetical protein